MRSRALTRVVPRSRVVVLVVALVALAGCTGGGSKGPGASTGTGGGGAAPRGRTGGTLAIALLDPGPLDPARADGLEDEVVLGNLFDGLTTIDPSGAVRPAVATSWSSDPALRRWEFRLRPGARWSDGSPLRASDFAFAWHRLADPKARPGPSPARTLLSGVTGYRAFAAGRARSIAGLETPGPSTLVVRLDQPFADLPALVAALPLSPLPAALVRPDPAAYLSRPVGNGPFQLAAPARPGRALTLDRNPAYQGSPALLDRVKVQVVPDEQTAWLELQNGRAAFAPVPRPARRRTTVTAPRRLPNAPRPLRHTLTTWQLISPEVDLGQDPPAPGVSPPSTATGSPQPGGRGDDLFPLHPAAAPPHLTARPAPRPPMARTSSTLTTTTSAGTLALPPGADARRVATLLADDLNRRWVQAPPETTLTADTDDLVRTMPPPPPRPVPRHSRLDHPNAQPLDRPRQPDEPAREPYRADPPPAPRRGPLVTEHQAPSHPGPRASSHPWKRSTWPPSASRLTVRPS